MTNDNNSNQTQIKNRVLITKDYKGIKLDKFLTDKYGVSFSFIRKMCRKGQVRINSSRVKGNEVLKIGDEVKIPNSFISDAPQVKNEKNIFSDKELGQAKKWILYEDDDILVINKPFGVPVQAGSKQEKSLDRLFVQLYKENPPKLVHRLDKDTSGCLVMAKNKSAAKFLADQFAKREMNKIYLAIAVGDLLDPEGEITFELDKVKEGHSKDVVRQFSGGREAITKYKRLSRHKNYHLLEVKIETGRTHQIRVHLKDIGVPILGDTKYSDRSSNKLKTGKQAKMCLHSYKLEIQHPKDGRIIEFSAPLPEHMQEIMKELRLDFK